VSLALSASPTGPLGINSLRCDLLMPRGPLPCPIPLGLWWYRGSSAKLVLSCETSEDMRVILKLCKVLVCGEASSGSSLQPLTRIPNNYSCYSQNMKRGYGTCLIPDSYCVHGFLGCTKVLLSCTIFMLTHQMLWEGKNMNPKIKDMLCCCSQG
jgi:hypothetical protein